MKKGFHYGCARGIARHETEAWKPETVARVRERVAEVIELADEDVLDVMRSRFGEQEVLDLLDESSTR